MQAVLLSKSGAIADNLSVGTIEKPKPGPDDVLIKLEYAAINPVDWKMAKIGFLIQSFPIVLGCDGSGTVEEVGANVHDLKKGDEVFAFTRLGTPGAGTFAEYAVSPAVVTGKKPSSVSFQEAATFPVGLLTAALGIFDSFQLALPSAKTPSKDFLLVWGGATSVGQYAVQLGKAIGMTVIATCSARNVEWLKELGADHALDYNKDPLAEIKKITDNKLHYAYNTVSAECADFCVQSLSSSEPAHVASCAEKPSSLPDNVTYHNVFLGAELNTEERRKLIGSYYREFEPLIATKVIKPNKVQLLEKGLGSVAEGFKLSAEGKVSAQKLVVKVAQ